MSEQYKKQRVIPQQPYKVLDAPCLQDDFYLNLVDWSTYVVDRGDFKLLQNSIFPDKDGGNVFVEMEAGSIILTEKVTDIIC